MLSQQLIKRLRDDAAFKEFSKWIVSEIDKLNSVEGLSNLDNEKAGQEVKVRFEASKRLKKILEPVLGFKEKKENTTQDVADAKKKVGL